VPTILGVDISFILSNSISLSLYLSYDLSYFHVNEIKNYGESDLGLPKKRGAG
jgi:hypothetical protein